MKRLVKVEGEAAIAHFMRCHEVPDWPRVEVFEVFCSMLKSLSMVMVESSHSECRGRSKRRVKGVVTIVGGQNIVARRCAWSAELDAMLSEPLSGGMCLGSLSDA